jgi:uridylate kinase
MSDLQHIVISLGGSTLVQDEVNSNFLKNFIGLVLRMVEIKKTFTIIVGGGKVCRKYQKALQESFEPSNDDLDWLGIHTTHLNAHLLRLAFGSYAFGEIITDPNVLFETEKPVVVGGGWKPGFSTDFDAVTIAIKTGAKHVFNLTNISNVYDSDPKENPNAKKFDTLSWDKYRSFIPKDWRPGFSAPFDPIASKLAEENGVSVTILNGSDLDNVERALRGELFEGTTIS